VTNPVKIDDITVAVERLKDRIREMAPQITPEQSAGFAEALSELLELVMNRSTALASQTVLLMIGRLDRIDERIASDDARLDLLEHPHEREV
jgi:hypothetical protein